MSYTSSIAGLYASWDDAVSTAVFSGLKTLGFDELQPGKPSSLTRDLPWVCSPTPAVTAITAYLLIIVASVAYQRATNKKPYAQDPLWLRLLVQAHNLILIVLSTYMSVSAVYCAVQYGYRLWGNAYQPSQGALAHTVWVFYMSKFYEFFDTIIMVLKGKLNQVSFLHVYHHTTISAVWWAITFAAPGGDAWYSVFLNSLVHVLMYTYYFTAAALGKDDGKKRRYLWWGRYLTQFQMFQFVTMMVQGTYCWLVDKRYPLFLSKLLVGYMVTLLALFADFYVRKHHGRRGAKGGSSKTPAKEA